MIDLLLCKWLKIAPDKYGASSSFGFICSVQTNKGGNPEIVKESQRKRGASVELVDEVLDLYRTWTSRESFIAPIL